MSPVAPVDDEVEVPLEPAVLDGTPRDGEKFVADGHGLLVVLLAALPAAERHRRGEQFEESGNVLLVFPVLRLRLEQVADVPLEVLKAVLHPSPPGAVVGAVAVHAEDADVRALAEDLRGDGRRPGASEPVHRDRRSEEAPCVAAFPVARPRGLVRVLDRGRAELLDEPRDAALQQLRDLVRHLLQRGLLHAGPPRERPERDARPEVVDENLRDEVVREREVGHDAGHFGLVVLPADVAPRPVYRVVPDDAPCGNHVDDGPRARRPAREREAGDRA